MQIHHRQNEDAIWLLGIENPIGKSPDQRPSDIPVKQDPGFWIFDSPANRRQDFERKVMP